MCDMDRYVRLSVVVNNSRIEKMKLQWSPLALTEINGFRLFFMKCPNLNVVKGR
jgi:hypothetical protein